MRNSLPFWLRGRRNVSNEKENLALRAEDGERFAALETNANLQSVVCAVHTE